MARPLVPVIDSPWITIGPRPELGYAVSGDPDHEIAFLAGDVAEHNATVDHHIVRDAAGAFHLWGCVRATAVGRVLYRWESDAMEQAPWHSTGEVIRVSREAGESIDDWGGEEWIQSPFFVEHDGTWYMFYGGHRAGVNESGEPVAATVGTRVDDPSAHQICLMTSNDGRSWRRRRNADGTSRLFLGPGEARDPCVIRVGDEWLMYYAGYFDAERPAEGAGFIVRTSRDLVSWSDWRLVHRDPSFGAAWHETECPFVCEREGRYYLFRTVDYYRALTYVFVSDDPFDFGIGNAREKLVGRIACAAPEIYEFDGVEYLSSSHAPLEGEKLCRLRWIEFDRASR